MGNENCEVKYQAQCETEISGTSDMLCTCELEGVDTTEEFQRFDGSDDRVCCGPGGSDDSKDSYYELHDVSTLAECKQLCRAKLDACTGIEWWEAAGRCEVWQSPIGSSKPMNGFMCLRMTTQ